MIKLTTAFACLLISSAPAFAQSVDAPLPDPDDRSDTVTIGGGAGWLPDYEGSDDYEIVPGAAIRGRVSGIGFFTRGTYLYVDFVPRGSGALEFDAGPIAGVRFNRTSDVKDDVVDELEDRDAAIELGVFAGVTYHGLTNPYDALSFRLDVLKDVSGAHESTVISPTIDFGTPLSRKTFIGASLSADWAGDGYADYYYSLGPQDFIDSGLPLFDADGGFKSWRIGVLAGHSLTGDLTKGLSIVALGSYSRLGGDFADSPIVDDRGSASQWMGALGLAYTF